MKIFLSANSNDRLRNKPIIQQGIEKCAFSTAMAAMCANGHFLLPQLLIGSWNLIFRKAEFIRHFRQIFIGYLHTIANGTLVFISSCALSLFTWQCIYSRNTHAVLEWFLKIFRILPVVKPLNWRPENLGSIPATCNVSQSRPQTLPALTEKKTKKNNGRTDSFHFFLQVQGGSGDEINCFLASFLIIDILAGIHCSPNV